MRQIALFLAVLLAGCSGGGTPMGGSGGVSGSGGNDTGGSGGSVTGGSGGGSGGGGSGGGGSGGSAGASGSGGSAGSSGSGGSAGASGSGGTTADASAPDASPGDGGVANPGPSQFPIPPGMTPIFDGKTLNGWTGSTAIWSVDAETMSIHGKTNNGGQLLKSAGDYDDFRLVVTERAVATMNHMGICFWGTRPGNGYGGCIDVIPPSGSMWDYGGGGQVPNQGVGSANNPIKFMWHQVEILATGSTGEILVAVNGKQTSNYKKAGRGRKGPIGFQAHAGASDQEYKDVYVEVAPKEHRLLTLKP
jgi:hypothetical protein